MAHAWKACWVHALTSSNLVSSANKGFEQSFRALFHITKHFRCTHIRARLTVLPLSRSALFDDDGMEKLWVRRA